MKARPPHVLISNPDMLHLGFLPYHDAWIDFFRNLRYVIIDGADASLVEVDWPKERTWEDAFSSAREPAKPAVTGAAKPGTRRR